MQSNIRPLFLFLAYWSSSRQGDSTTELLKNQARLCSWSEEYKTNHTFFTFSFQRLLLEGTVRLTAITQYFNLLLYIKPALFGLAALP